MKEIKEFKQKYSFAIKEIKDNVIQLIEFKKFINSNEWNSMNYSERFIFLVTLSNLNTTDNILPNNIRYIEDNIEYARYNYGDYNELIIDYFNTKPININEFAKEYSFLVEKIENEMLVLKEYDIIINSNSLFALSFEDQYELLRTIEYKLIDENRIIKRIEDNNKKEKELKYKLPKIKINCKYVSEKWNNLYLDYLRFNQFTLGEFKPKTEKEQVTYFGIEYDKLYKENSSEKKGLTNKVYYILRSLDGGDEKIKFVESRYNNIIKEEKEIKHTEKRETKKIPAKFYALYHSLLIEMGTEKPFERNKDDNFSKIEIEAFAKERYPNVSSQGFYRAFIDIDLTNKTRVAQIFGKDYKERIIEISNNGAKIIKHLQKYPN